MAVPVPVGRVEVKLDVPAQNLVGLVRDDRVVKVGACAVIGSAGVDHPKAPPILGHEPVP